MGEVFAGRYELIDMLGEGGMGAVWRVRDLKRDRIVAAKVLRQSDAGSLLRFMREQGVRIHHPNVVTPLGWAGEDDQVLFTMPIVEGGSVADLLQGSAVLPPRFGAEILRQLLMALDAVHSEGVVHRDIKPANLLLDDTGTGRPHVWLTDFGVALPVDAPRLTAQSMVMGTPGYLAPEQLKGAEPDPVSDLYAAGMVGIQLATGHRPKPQMRTERLDLPPGPREVPRPLWDLLVSLADPDPSGRPQTARAALAALEHPELTWQEQQTVNIPRRMPELSGVAEGEFVRPGESAGTTPQSHGQTAPAAQAATVHQPVGNAAGSVHSSAPAEPTRPAVLASPADRPTSASSGRGRLVALIAAAVIGVGALGAVWWPRSSEPPAGDIAQSGGTCGWWDAGATAKNEDGSWLRCQGDGDTYTWQE